MGARGFFGADRIVAAPGHGVDDFNTGQRYGLEVAAPLNARGIYTEGNVAGAMQYETESWT